MTIGPGLLALVVVMMGLIGLVIGYTIAEYVFDWYRQWRMNILRKDCGLEPRPMQYKTLVHTKRDEPWRF